MIPLVLVLVISGVNNIALSHAQQALLQQPGLKPQNVYVAFSTMFGKDYESFIQLFDFKGISVKPTSRYVGEYTARSFRSTVIISIYRASFYLILRLSPV